MNSATRLTRTAAAMAIVAVMAVAAACTPSPTGGIFEGGTYDLDLSLPPQHASETFPLFGMGTCTVTVDTPEIRLAGATLVVGDAEIDQTDGTATIADARVVVPRSTVPLGTVSLECFGHAVGTLGVAADISATASLQAAVFDAEDYTLTLVEPTISIPDARLLLTLDGTALPPLELPPIEVAVPTVSTHA